MLRLAKDRPDRDIDILRWNFGGLKQLVMPRIVAMLLRWKVTRSISFRLDSAHPVGCSHHQKVAVFDDHLAVCGGIDVGSARWDTRSPKDGEPRRRTPGGQHYMQGHASKVTLRGLGGEGTPGQGKARDDGGVKQD